MTDPYLLFHLSDIHFGLEDNRALDWVKQEIADKRPDAVAITGDLTMRARQHEFDAACAWIRSLEASVTVEVGNHDLPYFNPVQRFFDPYKRIRAIADKGRDRDRSARACHCSAQDRRPLAAAPELVQRLGDRGGAGTMPYPTRCATRGDARTGDRAPPIARSRHPGHRIDPTRPEGDDRAGQA
ncbi:metallophosphoesterase [Lamprobacter modestohalophilus]|uniref:metallophosphoesterase family protein n=1 Tax=Lamprobacter modestohalophilus TaxID=1064514 RepID=UPI002ADEF9C1|nr:metallophosphoesterase [Lamprobacter modestohalophilus]MEA1052089.1 metallophosphoesterase [Lamprobacter modestohalophilus]